MPSIPDDGIAAGYAFVGFVGLYHVLYRLDRTQLVDKQGEEADKEGKNRSGFKFRSDKQTVEGDAVVVVGHWRNFIEQVVGGCA